MSEQEAGAWKQQFVLLEEQSFWRIWPWLLPFNPAPGVWWRAQEPLFHALFPAWPQPLLSRASATVVMGQRVRCVSVLAVLGD